LLWQNLHAARMIKEKQAVLLLAALN